MQLVWSSPTVACSLITSHLVLEAQASHPKSPQLSNCPLASSRPPRTLNREQGSAIG